jgi:hypothetical protein
MPRKNLVTEQLRTQVNSVTLVQAELNLITERVCLGATPPFGRDAGHLRQAVDRAENRARAKTAERGNARRGCSCCATEG